MRPVMCEVADHTPSDVNVARKDRFWGIFVQRTSQRIQWTFQRVSRDCTERSVAGSLLTVYPDAADALDALIRTITGINIPQNQKRSKKQHDADYQQQNILEAALRLLRACRVRDAVPNTINDPNEPRRSTMWTPVGRKRIDSPSDISGCPCASGYKFGKWLYYDCAIGLHIVTPNTRFDTSNSIIPAVLHYLKFQVLSQCRTHPIDIPNIMRGVIDDTDLGSLRVAGTAADFMRSEPSYDMTSDHKEAWDSTDKHKVLWLVPTKLLQTVAGISTGGKGSGGKGSGGSKGRYGGEEGRVGGELPPTATLTLGGGGGGVVGGGGGAGAARATNAAIPRTAVGIIPAQREGDCSSSSSASSSGRGSGSSGKWAGECSCDGAGKDKGRGRCCVAGGACACARARAAP
jgi:hypothetical protein